MIKETIPFHDLDGNEIEADYYFNMFTTELAEWNFEHEGGLEGYIKKLQKTEDQGAIMKFMKESILKAGGKKSEEGLRFIKTPEYATEFSQTEAFHVLFMKLASDEKEATRFISGIVPNMPTDNKPAAVKKTTKK